MKQRITALLLFVLSLSFYSCAHKNDAVFAIPELIDAIHQSSINPTFRKADGLKYHQDYAQAAKVFEGLLATALTPEERCYALSQLAFINLKNHQDTLATIWIFEIEKTFSSIKNDTTALGADYFFNKGVLEHHKYNVPVADSFLQKAFGLYQKNYPPHHIKTIACIAQMVILKNGFAIQSDSMSSLMKKAAVFLNKNAHLKAYCTEFEYAQALIGYDAWNLEAALGHCNNVIKSMNPPKTDSILLSLALNWKGITLKSKAEDETDSLKKKVLYQEAESFLMQSVDISRKKRTLFHQKNLTLTAIHFAIRSDSAHFFNYFNELKTILKTEKAAYGQTDWLMGSYHKNRHNLTLANDYFKKQWQNNCGKSNGSKYITEAVTYSLFKNYNDLRLFDSALHYLKLNYSIGSAFEGKALDWQELYQRSRDDRFLYVYMMLAVESLLGKYKRTNDISALSEAYNLFNISDSLLFQKNILTDDDALISYQKEYTQKQYSNAMEITFQLFKKTHNAKYLEGAFRFSERTKSMLLYRSISDTTVANHLPPQYLDTIRSLNAAINKVKWGVTSTQQTTLQLTDLQNKLDLIYKNILKTNPSINTFAQPTPSVKMVQKQLLGNQTVVHYSLGLEKWHRIIISKNGFDFQEFDSVKLLIADIQRFRAYLSSENSTPISAKDYATLGQKLYAQLLGKSSIQPNMELIIIPDKTLFTIPFEALVKPSKVPFQNFRELPFAIKEYQFVYSSAWKIYQANCLKKLPQNLAIGVYTYDETTKELPYSTIEIQAIKDNFKENITLFKGKKCSKVDFINSQSRFDILHFSLHAASDATERMNNKIYFSPQNRDTLYGFEVLNQPLKAKLAVLSTCQSAVGKIETGEGTFSLSRSFQQAGVPMVIAAQWQIDDATSAKIIKSFYDELKLNHSPPQCLHKAKLLFLKNEDKALAHPKYWSGLTISM